MGVKCLENPEFLMKKYEKSEKIGGLGGFLREKGSFRGFGEGKVGFWRILGDKRGVFGRISPNWRLFLGKMGGGGF